MKEKIIKKIISEIYDEFGSDDPIYNDHIDEDIIKTVISKTENYSDVLTDEEVKHE